MLQVTWPSRSYFVVVAASLVSAWVIISIASRLIRNRSLAKIFVVVAWSIAAMKIFGVLDNVTSLLDLASFSMGQVRVSLLILIKAVFMLALLLWLAAVVGDFLDQRIRRDLDLTPAFQVLVGKTIKFLLITAAFLVSLSSVGVDLTALTVLSGAIGIGIGFGLQKVASNLISGMIILLDRSIKPGDVIAVGNSFGWISSLNARYVSLVTREGIEYLIPNENFVSETVVNWSYSDRSIRHEIKFGVSYNSDPHLIRKIAVGAVSNVARVLDNPAPVCHFSDFGDSSIDFVLRFWIDDPENGMANVKGAVMLALWDAFKEHNIDIPFPHREVIMRTPVELTAPTLKKPSVPGGGAGV